MRAVALELCDVHGWRVRVAGRLEAMTEVAVGRVDVEVEVCFGERGVRYRGVWVDC
jgi:hypothetical protein